MNTSDKIKQKIWHFIYKFFPTAQKALLRLGIIWHMTGRQRYHIGWLAPGKTLEGLKQHLHTKWDFGNHFIAWEDNEQVLSWRRLIDFQDQYHLRVYKDGEISGHFEFTPEAHPIKHMKEKGEVERKEEFMKFLGDFVTEEKHTSHLKVDSDAFNLESGFIVKDKK